MSTGIDICAKCGGEVRVSEGYGGYCPHCGSWVSAGTINSIEREQQEYLHRKEEREERMKHVIGVTVEYQCDYADRYYATSKSFTDVEEAKRWASEMKRGYFIFHYYDERGLIE